MVFRHSVPYNALTRATHFVREVERAFAVWQRTVVAIWAINPQLSTSRLHR